MVIFRSESSSTQSSSLLKVNQPTGCLIKFVSFPTNKTQVEMSLILSTSIYCKSMSTLYGVSQPCDTHES